MAWGMLNDHPDLLAYLESYWLPILFARYGARPAPAADLLGLVRETTHPGSPRPVFEGTLEVYGVDPSGVYDEFLRADGDTRLTIAEFNDRLTAVVLARVGKSAYADKTPHYYLHMQALQTLWPGLVFVNIVRHGVAVARSMQHHAGFQINAKVGVDDWAALARVHLAVPDRAVPLAEYLAMWARQTLRARDEATRLRPGSYLEVRFEDLVREPVRTLGEVCAFAGLRPDPAWLRRQQGLVRPDRLTTGGRPDHIPAEALDVLAELGYSPDDPLPVARPTSAGSASASSGASPGPGHAAYSGLPNCVPAQG